MERESERRESGSSPDSNAEEKEKGSGEAASQPQSAVGKFPVVGLGASAGGLEALKAFFSHLPTDSGMAYIVLVHLSPEHPSMMPDLLQRTTSVPVKQAEDGESLQPDHIYVVPSHREISVYGGQIQLLEPLDKHVSLPIDFFLRALAAEQGSRSAAVILSGTGADGTVGLKEIKSQEGVVLVQSEETAKYSGMPRSAINTGQVDMVLSPEEMPQKLLQYFNYRTSVVEKRPPEEEERDWLHKIFALLRVQIGHDFSWYKKSSLSRRISRRMGLNQIEDHETYVRFLRQNPNELEVLFRELLIGVTNFFREPQSFEVLKSDVLPNLLDPLEEGAVFRAWVAGCSTGEEAYSLAIVLMEYLEETGKRVNLQLFGTDIDGKAIEMARQGVYPASIMADVSQERLQRFFHKEGDAYRIRKEVRDKIVFSVQDVLRDPPFSRLNLLLCRNLLIYLSSEAQKRLLPLFHYTLIPGGVLMLGSSETVGGHTDLFKSLNNTWKVYRRQEVLQSLRQQVQFPTGAPGEGAHQESNRVAPPEGQEALENTLMKEVAKRFAPPGVLVDGRGGILHILGKTGKYLEPASGSPTQNILDMAREGLRIELSSAIREAMGSRVDVFRKGVKVSSNGAEQKVDLHVCPLDTSQEQGGRLLVVFRESRQRAVVEPESTQEDEAPAPEGEGENLREYKARIAELEQELKNTKESHQTAIEELESSNEELKSTNEELQSSNEELQSTNEELESSKEELQSLNEELQTVNAELQSKVDELSAAQDDINNLLNSTQIATLFVDDQLRIKRFSRETTQVINLIESDVGRPLEHQVSKLEQDTLIRDLTQVLQDLVPVEREVRTTEGSWYIMRIMPYRTMDNRIQGAVVTFRNVDAQKQAQEALKELNHELEGAWALLRSVFDMNPEPLAVLQEQGKIVIANLAFSKLLNLTQQDIEGTEIYSITADSGQGEEFRKQLRSALKDGQDFRIDKLEMETSQGKLIPSVYCRVIRRSDDAPFRVLLNLEQEAAGAG